MVGDAPLPGLLESGFAGLADLLAAAFVLVVGRPSRPPSRYPSASTTPLHKTYVVRLVVEAVRVTADGAARQV
jgi:hypothetical protein